MSAKLANLPDGVSVERGRIEVRFHGPKDALSRLYALAQALANDLLAVRGARRGQGRGRRRGRGGEEMTNALMPVVETPGGREERPVPEPGQGTPRAAPQQRPEQQHLAPRAAGTAASQMVNVRSPIFMPSMVPESTSMVVPAVSPVSITDRLDSRPRRHCWPSRLA